MYNPEEFIDELFALSRDFEAQDESMQQRAEQCYIDTVPFFQEVRTEQENLANNQEKIHSEICNLSAEVKDDTDKSHSQIMDFFRKNEKKTERFVKQTQDLTKIVAEKL